MAVAWVAATQSPHPGGLVAEIALVAENSSGADSGVRPTGLPGRLREQTAQAHRLVEALVDIAGSVVTRADYIALLRRLHGVHSGLEDRLAEGRWDQRWAAVDVDIAAHCRSGLLIADLAELDSPVTGPSEQPPFHSFGHAMGCLYVLEGSALGGRTIAGIVRSAIGPVPTAFLTGRGRVHQAAWPAVRRSLRLFDAQGGNCNEVVAGALATFGVFGEQLARQASRP